MVPVLFTWRPLVDEAAVERVYLSCDSNGWQREPMELEEDGYWRKVVHMPEGEREYFFWIQRPEDGNGDGKIIQDTNINRSREATALCKAGTFDLENDRPSCKFDLTFANSIATLEAECDKLTKERDKLVKERDIIREATSLIVQAKQDYGFTNVKTEGISDFKRMESRVIRQCYEESHLGAPPAIPNHAPGEEVPSNEVRNIVIDELVHNLQPPPLTLKLGRWNPFLRNHVLVCNKTSKTIIIRYTGVEPPYIPEDVKANISAGNFGAIDFQRTELERVQPAAVDSTDCWVPLNGHCSHSIPVGHGAWMQFIRESCTKLTADGGIEIEQFAQRIPFPATPRQCIRIYGA